MARDKDPIVENLIAAWDAEKKGELPDKGRIQLSLSSRALQVLDRDSDMMFRKINYSGFINYLIQNFFDAAESNVEKAVRDYRRQTEKSFSASRKIQALERASGSAEALEAYRSAMTDELVSRYRERLLARLRERCSRSYQSRNIRFSLDNASKKILYASDDYVFQSGGSEKKLPFRKVLTGLVEEYCSFGSLEREEILYRDIIRKLQACCPKGQNGSEGMGSLLRLLYFTSGTTFSFENVRPYLVASDGLGRYHYLYCMIPGDSHPDKLRISRIIPGSVVISDAASDQEVLSRGSLFSDKEMESLEKELRGDSGEARDFYVYLNEKGKALFDQILYDRPIRIREEHPRIIQGTSRNGLTGTWECCRFHDVPFSIRNYFVKLGPNAIVIDAEDAGPGSVHDVMRRDYEEAARNYAVDPSVFKDSGNEKGST